MINPQDENELRGLLYLADDAPLPEAVETLYLRVKKFRDRRYAAPMSLDLLVMIAVQAGLLPEAPEKIVDASADSGQTFHAGDEVEVLWQDAWHAGVIKGKHRHGVSVQVAGDESPFRVFKPEQIRVLQNA